jgi:hypothetical protein
MVTAEDVRRVAGALPRSEEHHWVRVWLDAIDREEMEELVVEAWRMVVPKRVAATYPGPGP